MLHLRRAGLAAFQEPTSWRFKKQISAFKVSNSGKYLAVGLINDVLDKDLPTSLIIWDYEYKKIILIWKYEFVKNVGVNN